VVMSWTFLGLPIVKVVVAMKGMNVVLPAIDSMPMMDIIVGMLGLGGFRTWEKIKGVAAR